MPHPGPVTSSGSETRLVTPGLVVALPSPKCPPREGLQGKWERRNRQDVFKDQGSYEGLLCEALPTAVRGKFQVLQTCCQFQRTNGNTPSVVTHETHSLPFATAKSWLLLVSCLSWKSNAFNPKFKSEMAGSETWTRGHKAGRVWSQRCHTTQHTPKLGLSGPRRATSHVTQKSQGQF